MAHTLDDTRVVREMMRHGMSTEGVPKQMMREGIITELKKRKYYEKPSAVLRKKMKNARFEAMLKQRYAED